MEKGDFNFIIQLPISLYSTIFSALINMILKLLSLTEKDFLDIKEEKDNKIATGKSKVIEKYIKKKIIIFFILSFVLMSFLFYFISCFCAIYKNTQIILIKDTIISFCLSMIYPFGLYLLPGLMRIPALRAKNKDKEKLYKVSKVLSLL